MESSTISPFKLSFNSLPRHETEPSGLATPPPFRVPAAVPFIWEEKPGRPRKESALEKPNKKPLSGRSLELPPRMVAEEFKMKTNKKNTVSPTSILDVQCALSRPRSFGRCYSFNAGNETSQGNKGRKYATKGNAMSFPREQRRESNRASSSSSVSSSSFCASSSCVCDEGKESRVKIAMFRRHHSLINVSLRGTSHLWIGIYKSLRQVVPWHRT